MIDRILTIIKSRNISPSQFADEIGVQRSSISHLIAGRNKPSLEFVQKIIGRYPEINVEWILTGNGTMSVDGSIQGELSLPVEMKDKSAIELPQAEEIKPKRKRNTDQEEKKIEKIVYFFTDKTFSEYYPQG